MREESTKKKSISKTETGWDLGPFPAVPHCSHLNTPLLQQQNANRLYGAEDNSMHAHLGQILDPKIQRPKPHLPLDRSLERKQGVESKSRVLRMPPAHVTATLGDTPTLIPLRNKLAPLTCRVDLIFLCYSRGPSKALPGFLVWPLINFS